MLQALRRPPPRTAPGRIRLPARSGWNGRARVRGGQRWRGAIYQEGVTSVRHRLACSCQIYLPRAVLEDGLFNAREHLHGLHSWQTSDGMLPVAGAVGAIPALDGDFWACISGTTGLIKNIITAADLYQKERSAVFMAPLHNLTFSLMGLTFLILFLLVWHTVSRRHPRTPNKPSQHDHRGNIGRHTE